MYKHIYIPVDNSEHSNRAIDLAIDLAKAFGAKITGSHAYAAKLHDVRFKQMEFTLPEEYQEEKELEKQRKIHDSLITMGLQLISDSYLELLEKKCREAQVPFEKRMQDGKNWQVIIQEIQEIDSDLVILGALGTGAVKHSQLGSVCERVMRRSRKDTLVLKDTRPLSEQTGPILVAVDGSPQAFAGVKVALNLAQKIGRSVEAIAVYDPYLHYTVFNGIVDVLSEKASKIFRFKEQEQLHEDIIDTGLAKIYQSHLEVAAEMAKQVGVSFKANLKDGKAFEKVYQFAESQKPFLLISGRIGVHSVEDMDIGSNAENILRLVSCNVLLISQKFVPPIDVKADASMIWTEEAKKRFEKVPEQVRKIARTAVHRYAMERGHSIITNSIIDACMEIFMPKTAKHMESLAFQVAQEKISSDLGPRTSDLGPVYICSICGKVTRGTKPVVCTVCRAPGERFEPIQPQDVEALAQKEGGLTEETTFDGMKLKWTEEARTAYI
ncbi:MAG: universal stress protein, partial [Elusimicrobia bacterium]|nr:universal stress protein [Elusimicrobiota bacterium]